MKIIKNIFLIRHCKASGQEPEAALTDDGLVQSFILADFLIDKGIETIVSSPYLRSVKSIEPLSKKLGIKIELDNRLRERVLSPKNLPNWTEDLKETFNNLDLKFEGGESTSEAMNRGIEIVKELIHRRENNIVVVTHGNLLAIILKYYNPTFGFLEWKNLCNPDVYQIQFVNGMHKTTKRIWG